ncbi:hypothetical protein V8G54_020144 [Vigna mungo]|uniref:Uncharacterized protein n=1 Tax=Vigna mungo TaxID=3915 RepID=A0AAQ3RVN0_VIGMU
MGLIWGSWAGFSGCRVEDEDAREEMMEKKTVGEGFTMEVSGEEDDLAAIDGAAWRWCVNCGGGSLRTGGEDGGDARMTAICGSDGSRHGGSRLTTRLMVVEIGFGGDGKVGGSNDKGFCVWKEKLTWQGEGGATPKAKWDAIAATGPSKLRLGSRDKQEVKAHDRRVRVTDRS